MFPYRVLHSRSTWLKPSQSVKSFDWFWAHERNCSSSNLHGFWLVDCGCDWYWDSEASCCATAAGSELFPPMKAPVMAWPTVWPMATPAAVEATWAMRPPPGAAPIAGWATWAGGWGATAFWVGLGGGGAARRAADGDGDRPRPKAEPLDGDERRPILCFKLLFSLSPTILILFLTSREYLWSLICLICNRFVIWRVLVLLLNNKLKRKLEYAKIENSRTYEGQSVFIAESLARMRVRMCKIVHYDSHSRFDRTSLVSWLD